MRLLALFLSLFIYGASIAQPVAWLKKGGDLKSYCHTYGVTIDNSHNSIVSGVFYDTANFSGTILTSIDPHYYNGFLIKYDTTGNIVWAKKMVGDGHCLAGRTAVDAADNIYVAGNFTSTAIYFSPTDSLVKSSSGANSNGYLAKFDHNGTFLWAKLIASSSLAETWSVTVDKWGYLIIGGYWVADINVSGVSAAHTGSNLFIAKYTPGGSLDWAKFGLSSSICQISDITTDTPGNIYFTGNMTTNVSFGADTTHQVGPYGCTNMIWGKLDSAGNRIFAQSRMAANVFGGGNNGAGNIGNTIKADRLGNVYIGGSMIVNFVAPSTVFQEGFIAKYTNTGSKVWIDTFGRDSETVTSLVLDPNDDPYVTGYTYANDTIGGMIVPYTPGGNTFVAKLNKATGNAIWLKQNTSAGGHTDQNINLHLCTGALALDQATGAITLVGQYTNNIAFDTFHTARTSIPANLNIYVLRLMNHFTGLDVPVTAENAVAEVYPNPASNELNVVFGKEQWHKIALVNMAGQMIGEWQANSPSLKLDVKNIPAGNYLLLINDNANNNVTMKITKL